MPQRRDRTLERRLFGWTLALTLVPALILLAVGGWAVATSLEVAGALGPWEAVAASGLEVVERADPVGDTALAAALETHRGVLSRSLTQARRWAFLGERFVRVLPLLILLIGALLVFAAYRASRHMARQLARPIGELVGVAERLGRQEPLPAVSDRGIREVRVLDQALRAAASELELARDRALAAERVRVWGEMARRVAHEMKNPLTPLRLAAHRLDRGLQPEQPGGARLREAAEVVGQEVARLEELAGQFSALGRPPEGPATPVDLEEMLRSLLESDIPPEVDAVLDAEPGLPPVLAHHDPLLRAFRNVLRNAVEAMEGAATRRLRVTLTEAAGEEGAVPRWLDVRIRDTGSGLPPGDADRIFEPDFSTKSRGTGLGLALARQAVQGDGGTLTARSVDGGAEFAVRLPAVTTTMPSERD